MGICILGRLVVFLYGLLGPRCDHIFRKYIHLIVSLPCFLRTIVVNVDYNVVLFIMLCMVYEFWYITNRYIKMGMWGMWSSIKNNGLRHIISYGQ